MLINARNIDDFKTERKDLLPALPVIYRLVPILFYLSLAFLAVVGSTAMWHARVALQRYQNVVLATSALQGKIDATKAARSELEKAIREATDLENWVLGSMPLQPLVVEIVRSMDEGTTIVDLGIERDPETPSQLRLSLTLNSDSDKQIEETMQKVRLLDYREFSPTQSMVNGNYEYRASLLWRKPSGPMPSPQDRAKEIVQP